MSQATYAIRYERDRLHRRLVTHAHGLRVADLGRLQRCRIGHAVARPVRCRNQVMRQPGMSERSRVLTAACAGAALGGIWGWLYTTEGGRRLRDRIEPGFDRFLDELGRREQPGTTRRQPSTKCVSC